MKLLIRLLSILLLLLISTSAIAEEKIRVGISEYPPFVMKTADGYEGFGIEYWEEIADYLKLDFQYVFVEDFKDKLPLIDALKVDIAIGGISRTKERSQYDWGVPEYNAGQSMMVLNEAKKTNIVVLILKRLFSLQVFFMLVFLLFVVVALAFPMWWVERKNELIPKIKYHRELGKSGVEVAMIIIFEYMSTIGSGRFFPGTRKGYMIAYIAFLIGNLIISVVQAPIYSAFNYQNIEIVNSQYKTVRDLRGKIVATKEDTDAVRVARNAGAKRITQYKTIDEAIASLSAKKNPADVVVYDTAGLLYFEKYKGNGKVVVVGRQFANHYYAFAYPESSQLRRMIDEVQMKLYDNGVYFNLFEKWFAD